MQKKETDISKDVLKKRWSKLAILCFLLTSIFFANFIAVLISNILEPNVAPGILGISYLEPLNYIFRISLLPEFVLPAFFLLLNLMIYFRCKRRLLKGRIFSAIGIILSLLVSLTYLALFIIWSKGFNFRSII